MHKLILGLILLITPLSASVDLIRGKYLEENSDLGMTLSNEECKEFLTFNNKNQISSTAFPGADTISFEYEGDQIVKRSTSSGHILLNKLEEGKVVEQWANSLPGEEPVLSKKYRYEEGMTETETPAGFKKKFFHKLGEIYRIETYSNDKKESESRKTGGTWAEYDEFGHFFRSKTTIQDNKGRLAKEIFEGEGVSPFITTYTYEEDLLHSIETEYERQTFEYDSKGKIFCHLTENLETGKCTRTSYLYGSNGEPELIEEQSDGKEITRLLAYNEQKQIIREEIFDKALDCRKVRMTDYDEEGRPVYMSGEQGEIVFHYPEPLLTVSTNFTTGEIGRTWTDFQGNIVKRSVEKEDGTLLVQTQEFDSAGNLIASTDVLGNTTRYLRDPAGRLLQKIDPPILNAQDEEVSPITHYRHDGFGHLREVIDPEGGIYSISYNAYGKPVEVIHPDGRKDLYSYRNDGKLLLKQTVDGTKKELLTPSTIEVTSEEGIAIETIEVGEGEIRCGDQTLTAERDDLGTLVEIGDGITSLPVPPPEPLQGPQYDYSYTNEKGQKALRILTPKENGGISSVVYNAIGEVEEIKEFDSSGTLAAYEEYRSDGLGRRVLKKSYPVLAGRIGTPKITSWTYHPSGKIAETVEDGQRVRFEYFPSGALQSQIKQDGTALFYTYTPKGEVETIISSDGSIDSLFLYEEGKVVEAIDRKNGTRVSRSYDHEGNLVAEQGASGFQVESRYGSNGKREALLLPDGSSVEYEYKGDRLFAIHRLSSSGTYAHTYSKYSKDGHLQKAEMIGGIGEVETTRKPGGAITSIRSPYLKESLEYQGLEISAATLDGKTSNYSYDSLGQLIDEGKSPDSLFDYAEPAERDPNGRMVQIGDRKYLYDPLDRLIQVTTPKTKIRYEYDALGRCFAKKEGKKTSYYIFDGENEIGEYDGDSFQSLRILGIGHGAEIGAAIAVEIDGKTYAPCHDHLGSIIRLIDLETKKAVESYSYTPFGECEVVEGEGINPWRYMSKRFETEGSFYNFGKRCYSPESKQWMTRDPLDSFDGPNPYAFVHNNPLRNVDLHGLFSISAFIESALYNPVTSALDYLFRFQESLPSMGDICGYAEQLLNQPYLKTTGFYSESSHIGTYGNGLHPEPLKRVTFINGILTTEQDIQRNLHLISSTHGGCDVHYCYVGTKGWSNDMARAAYTWMFKVLSPEAEQLIQLWRKLIEEMGGVDGGGQITHYAHSLGGSETYIATQFLSPEEKRMMRIITFGSPTFIDKEGFLGVVNVVHRGDGVPWLNGIWYLLPHWKDESHIKFFGSRLSGYIIADHLFPDYFENFIFNFLDLTN